MIIWPILTIIAILWHLVIIKPFVKNLKLQHEKGVPNDLPTKPYKNRYCILALSKMVVLVRGEGGAHLLFCASGEFILVLPTLMILTASSPNCENLKIVVMHYAYETIFLRQKKLGRQHKKQARLKKLSIFKGCKLLFYILMQLLMMLVMWLCMRLLMH